MPRQKIVKPELIIRVPCKDQMYHGLAGVSIKRFQSLLTGQTKSSKIHIEHFPTISQHHITCMSCGHISNIETDIGDIDKKVVSGRRSNALE
jgi:hypothetical protein